MNQNFSEESAGFYQRLPRFVNELPEAGENNIYPEIERGFDYEGQKYTLRIVPAVAIKRAMQGLPNDPRSLYPGPDEERIEKILRDLAVPGNINFYTEDCRLCFSLTQIARKYTEEHGEDELTSERLDLSLQIIFDSRYFIERDGREFYFVPLEKLKCIEKDGELYYLLEFTDFFFNRGSLLKLIIKQ